MLKKTKKPSDKKNLQSTDLLAFLTLKGGRPSKTTLFSELANKHKISLINIDNADPTKEFLWSSSPIVSDQQE